MLNNFARYHSYSIVKGTMYMAGEGTPRDTLLAVEYFEKAMNAGKS